MKTLLSILLILAATTRMCRQDPDESTEKTSDAVGYVAEDVNYRKAIAEYEQCLDSGDSAVFAARVQISQAADRMDDPDIKNRRHLRSRIIKAEEQLERLSDKLLAAKKVCDQPYDEQMPERLAKMQEDLHRQREKLDVTLQELKQQ